MSNIKQTSLDVVQSHLLHRMYFGQYQTHQLRLGYSKMGVAIICSQVALALFVGQAEAL